MKTYLSLIPVLVISILLSGCSILLGRPDVPPELTTTKPSEIIVHYTDATLFGSIKKADSVVEVGFLLGTDENNLNTWAKGSLSSGKISVKLSGFIPGKKYYYIAAAKTRRHLYKAKTQYCFITFPQGPIDLDLPSGIRWADKNVGAEYPTDYGNYFAWGETEPKNYYDWTQYKFWNGDKDVRPSSVTKYGEDGKTELDPEDDVAHVSCGGDWRMPTSLELSELFDYCHITNVVINGVQGLKFISKKTMDDEVFIFMPFAGYIENASCNKTSTYYWSSTVNNNNLGPSAYNGHLGWYGYCNVANSARCKGEPVRAVCK